MSSSRSSARQGPTPKTARVAFNVVAETEIGETVCVSGDHPVLGAWNERDALELVTTPEATLPGTHLSPSTCPSIVRSSTSTAKTGGRFDRWEGAEGDRTFTAVGRDMVITDDVVPSRPARRSVGTDSKALAEKKSHSSVSTNSRKQDNC